MLTRSLVLLALAGPFVAGTARAQVPVPPVPGAPVVASDSTVHPFERPNGALLRQGTTVYDLTSTRAGQVAPLGTRTVQVQESTLAGSPAWLLTESRTGSAVPTSDSLYLTRSELAPVRWTATSGRAALGASFTRDTVFGALQSYQGRASFTVGMGPGALVTPGMVERVVELLPLAAGYRAAATLLVVELGNPHAQPAELAVEREEPVPLGDRTVDCWVVALHAGTTEERLWVTKEAPHVVKTEQAFGDAVLSAVEHPATIVMPPAVAADSSHVAPAPATPPVVPPHR